MTSLSDESRKAVDEYLQKLEEKLGELPDDERADAVAETRSHIEEAVARIREDEAAAVGTVLRGLGEPEAFAEGLVSGDAQEEPAVKAQPVPVTPAAAPPRRRSPVGWWIVGCSAVLMVPVVAFVGAYFALSGVQTKVAVDERKWLAQNQTATIDYELTALRDELHRALEARDAAGMAALCHSDLLGELNLSGERLLMPEGAGNPAISETDHLGPGRVQFTVRAGDAEQRYTFEHDDGAWRMRDFEPHAPP